MWTTTLARGYRLSYTYQADGWYSYINNREYPSSIQDALVSALMDAQREEVDKRLPDGCTWLPLLSEIIGPVDTTINNINQIMDNATAAVIDRFKEVEQSVLRIFE